jgi:hypothetical protein
MLLILIGIAMKDSISKHEETCPSGTLKSFTIKGGKDGPVKVTFCDKCDYYTIERIEDE